MSNLIERLRSNFPTTQAQWEAADRIEQLERENAAQLAELHAISDAIGTSDGHSSVYWINAVLADNARLREALLEISQVACSLSPEQKIANEALAKVRKP